MAAIARQDPPSPVPARPPFVDQAAVTHAYLTADRKRLAAALDDHVRSAAAGNAWREARTKAAQTVLSTITGNADTITRAPADLAAPLIATVTETARIDTHDTGALIRARRIDEAHAAARYDLDAGELSALYALRGKVTRGAVYGRDGVVCATWRDPRPVEDANRGKLLPEIPAETFRSGVLAGGVLWFPHQEKPSTPLGRSPRRSRPTPSARPRSTGARRPGRSSAPPDHLTIGAVSTPRARRDRVPVLPRSASEGRRGPTFQLA
ncbi:MAG: hypothetical protein WCA30_02860 [Dermatophilaceae bacterium]